MSAWPESDPVACLPAPAPHVAIPVWHEAALWPGRRVDPNSLKPEVLAALWGLSAVRDPDSAEHFRAAAERACRRVLPCAPPWATARLLRLHTLFPELGPRMDPPVALPMPLAGGREVRSTVRNWLAGLGYYNAVYTLSLDLQAVAQPGGRVSSIAHQLALLHQAICCCGSSLAGLRREIEDGRFAAVGKAVAAKGQLPEEVRRWLDGFPARVADAVLRGAAEAALRMPGGRALADFLARDLNELPESTTGFTNVPTSPAPEDPDSQYLSDPSSGMYLSPLRPTKSPLTPVTPAVPWNYPRPDPP